MKAILIRVAIALFIRWLRSRENATENDFVKGLLDMGTKVDLLKLLEHESTKKDINDIVTDIEDETVSNLFSDLIGK